MNKNLHLIFLSTLFLLCFLFKAHSITLSDQAKISVFTCGPNEEVYALYGHTAIRVKDPVHRIDLTFNYGIFSFNSPHFVYRFAKGETDYMVCPFDTKRFLQEYKKDQRSVYEQELNISPKDKQQIFDFLVWNAKKENREYRYNFFFDNCASKIRDVIVNQVDEKIIFPEKRKHPMTLRQLIKLYHSRNRWLNFGIDLVVAAPSDRIATAYEEMFLPDYLMDHFSKAQIQTQGKSQPLVKKTNCLYKAPEMLEPTFSITSPFVVFSVIVVLVLFISIRDFRRKKVSTITDYLVYGINGLMGIIILWFVLYSEHPAMSPNYNLIWAFPVNLLFTFVWIVKKWRPVTRWYHIFITVWLLLFVIFSQLLPQWFHPVFYLFVLMIISRSVLHTIGILKRNKALCTENT